MNFINSFQSEWLKKKRSLASWLVVAGAAFTPSIILMSRIKNAAKLSALYASNDFWQKLWNQTWESMAVFLLPFGIILAAGLIAQIEYKNNTWKQLHTTPQGFATIFFAKFLVLLIMLVEVFVLFNVGMYLSAVIPSMLFANLPYPTAPIPYAYFLKANINFFLDCLPILALQYLLSLQFKNFLVPIGTGFAIWFLGVGMLPWNYSYLLPYLHGTIDFLISSGQFGNRKIPPLNIQLLAVIYFVLFTVASYVLYVTKKEKG
ncbi:MAG: lantibiotic transport system permease protein [Pyrinomonadaceae bacterium]|nr:lantibiotic transport system permease protein [Pyrinomonadaceae bacterium]